MQRFGAPPCSFSYGRAGLTPEQVRAFFRAVTQAHAQIREGEGKE
jgi:hypothetical protein